MCGDCTNLRFFLPCCHWPGKGAQRFDRPLGRTVQSAFDVDGARAGNHITDTVSENCMGQDRRGAGPVADHVTGFFGGLTQHPRAQILFGIPEVEFLGDGDTIVADDRYAPFLLDQHRF